MVKIESPVTILYTVLSPHHRRLTINHGQSLVLQEFVWWKMMIDVNTLFHLLNSFLIVHTKVDSLLLLVEGMACVL